jgi:arsenate reductase
MHILRGLRRKHVEQRLPNCGGGFAPRPMLREKATPYPELGLGNMTLTDGERIDAMLAHPILINRPLVVTERGVKLCRPSELVLDMLPAPQRDEFTKRTANA